MNPTNANKTMRPPRANSPKQTMRVGRSESLRQRCSDKNTHEIIRFVRDIQFERQPTSLRLHRKAPLPGIGQSACSKSGTSDSGFLDRATDSSDDDVIDNEIYSIQKRVDPRSDPFIKDMLTLTRSHTKSSTDYEFLSRLMPQDPKDLNNNNHNPKLSRQTSFVRHSKKVLKIRGNPEVSQRNGHHVTKQLPPLSRDDGLERPTAPSPCRTPPASDSSFIEEEPVDFLDVS